MTKQNDQWDTWYGSEGVSEDAFASRDQPLERLKGSVRGYDRPFDPVAIESWEAHNKTAISAAVMRAMPNIALEWGCPDAEMAALLGLEVTTYQAWSSDPSQAALDPEQRERASLLLGIYKALMNLFPLADRQRRWIHQPNQGAYFQGSTPIELLRHGGLPALRELRAHLDAEQQGGFA